MRHLIYYLIPLMFFSSPVFSNQGDAASASSQIGANGSWHDWFFATTSVIILGIGLTVVGLNQGSPPDTSSSH